jgi:5-methylcytosine-specific restriction endonuclease McrA
MNTENTVFNLEAFLTEAKNNADRSVRQKQQKAKRDAFMQSETWARIRQRKLTNALNRCERCGATDNRLYVSHKTYDRFGGDERTTDLQVLCKPCHERAHGRKF